MNDPSVKRKLGWVILIIELALVIASIVVALGQGWDQVVQPLQMLVVLTIGTIFALLYEELWLDHEKQREQHPGTYHEVKT
ncbi:MAG: hypothetical protein KAQ65_05605 [Candidatus Thorarchaeota archaeon]|nr:hypothetical protein [Candidatus Thorarchaeota archaeon]MCK5238152.1 hypothetical protein [Candidatus Thorarchaeota archaeon]